MVVISRPLFYEKLNSDVKCQHLVHKWTNSCLKANFHFMLAYGKGIIYFYVPIYLMKLIINYKKVNKKHIKNLLKAFLKSATYAVALAALLINSICISSNVLQRLYFSNITFLPGFISGLSIFLEQPENRYYNTLFWMTMVVEGIFRNAYFFKIVNYSPIKETLIFMMCSSWLMYLLSNTHMSKIPSNIWFYKHNVNNNCNCKNCEHGSVNCIRYSFKECLNYFGFGFIFNSVRCFISQAGDFLKNPLKVVFSSICNKSNLKFGSVLGAYVGIFRLMLCFVSKNNNPKNSSYNAAIAGLVAGTAYYIKPTINILAIAITTIIQVLCKKFLTIPKSLEKVPFTEILFMFFNGILFANRIISVSTCPRYYVKMLRVGSGGLFDLIYSAIINNYISS